MDLSTYISNIFKLAASDSDLGRIVSLSMEIINLAIDVYGQDSFFMSFNGGKDCTVTLFLLLAVLNIRATTSSSDSDIFPVFFKNKNPELVQTLFSLSKEQPNSVSEPHQNSTDLRTSFIPIQTSQIRSLEIINFNLEISTLFKNSFDSSEFLENAFKGSRIRSFLSKGHFDLPADPLPNSPIKTLYIRTSSNFPEVEEFVQLINTACNLNLVIIENDMKSALLEYKELHPECVSCFIGTRRCDPAGKYSDYFKTCDLGWPDLVRICPVLDWSYTDIWKFILDLNLPRCSIYEKGYTSVGDIQHTRANPILLVNGTYKPAWLLSDSSLERYSRQ
ncbi:hypothetical protein BB560_001561 [Smittium megazygosporum]|uniref:FAD synthase n=1 Tax=Smittium megazygosporum TaxID=133381 RepID=A0A2T9ZH93_9FUNG|nr:hypothetical protein BB560_001561 [Smittium megazygosporum]